MFKMIKDMFATFRRQKQVCVPSFSCAVSELRASTLFLLDDPLVAQTPGNP